MNSIVLGTFFGDEGKGQMVNNLCKSSIDNGRRPLVVRFSGGHQVGHNVLHNGIHHCFSNFGSGTLLGVPTYWSEYCTVDPITALAELRDLESKISEPIKICYSPFCQIVVPFDVWHQWNDESNREHGTVGTGFKACLDRVKAGYSVTMADAKTPIVLREKLYAIMNHYYKVDSKLPMFNLDKWVLAVSTYVNHVKLRHFSEVRGLFDDLIFEGSQGILLDQRFGIMPFCTPSNTTCQNAMAMLGNEDVHHYYVCRPYITRHGNGPLCNSEPIIEVNDENNQYNDFQKTMRASKFSVELLKHSIGIDSLFYQPNRWNHRRLVFSHADEVSKELYDKARRTGLFGYIYGFEFENLRRL